MNNYWHTNYKADQGGIVPMRYAIRPHWGFETAAIKRFGLEKSQPLVVALSDGNLPIRPSLLEVEPSGAVVASLKPSADKKAWMVTLFNASSRPENIRLRGTIFREDSLALSNPSEDRLEQVRGPMPLLPFGIITLRIEK